MNDPIFSTASDLAEGLRARRFSARGLLQAHLAQIDRHHAALNAVVIRDDEAALARAGEADEAFARGESWGPLHGVPFTLKDAFAAEGWRTTVGFAPFERNVTRHDSTVAARLKMAGAVLIGRTNVPTLLADHQSDNPLFGRTSNPWDTRRTAGGSSGGAAAAIASGMTPFDIGTDLASSIRWPAHCCGVLGLKPTQHRVSLGGVVPDPRNPPRTIREMSCVGPMARSVDDLALLLRLISGPDAQDTDVAPAALGDRPPLSLRGARIAYSPDLGGLPVSRGVRSVLDAFARSLAARGAIVETPALPPLEPALQGAGELLGAMMGAMQGPGLALAEYFALLQRRDDCANAWERIFDRFDLLLCAAGPTTAFAHCASGTPLPADGASIDYQTIGAHGLVFNFTGQPALAMPCGHDDEGLPVGAQLVARRWDEVRLLAYAKDIEREIGGFVRPPL